MKYNSFFCQCPPGIILCASLILMILVGTCILSIPIMHSAKIASIDLLFTATSALCATGFFTVSLDQFSTLGHFILMLFIQIGGLGLITLALFFVYSFSHFDLTINVMASRLLDMNSWRDVGPIVFFICIMTILTELFGALLLIPFFINYYPLGYSIFLSLFHSISAFCNAGVWLIQGEVITAISKNNYILTILSLLIFIGSFGFIVWHELWIYYTQKISRNVHISLNAKLTIFGSLLVILIVTTLFIIFEDSYSMIEIKSILSKIFYAIFHGVSLRSAGFIFTPVELDHPATLFLMMVSGFIGTGSFSTGSGIKITTLVLLCFTIKTIITGRSEVEINGRSIPFEQVNKSLAIVFLSIVWIIFATFCLLYIEKNSSLGNILFAVTMAYSNLGVFSDTITNLSVYGKLIMIASMIVGRVGTLTIILGFVFKKKRIVDFSYPEERIMLS